MSSLKPPKSLLPKTCKSFMNLIKAGLCLFLILGAHSCAKKESNDPEDPEKEKKEIITILKNMWDAIEKEDMERYATYIHPDFTQFGEYDSILREGKKAEIEGISAWVDAASNIHTEMLDPKVSVNGNVAWIVYYWKDRGITDTGTFTSRGKSTRIFVKEDDKWLCIHGHYTLLP